MCTVLYDYLNLCTTVWDLPHGEGTATGPPPSGPTGVILRSRGVNEVFTPLKVRSQVQS